MIWKRPRSIRGLLDLAHLVFKDETAVSTNMVRLYGRGPRGEQVIDEVPQGTWKTTTLWPDFGMTGSSHRWCSTER